MDSRTLDRATTPDATATPEAIEFVRFCRHRRSVGWPELYDEMCAVAGRGLFRGWGADELGAHGIGFSLFDMPRLAVLVQRVIADEREGRVAAPVAGLPTSAAVPVVAMPIGDDPNGTEQVRMESGAAESDRSASGEAAAASRDVALVNAGV